MTTVTNIQNDGNSTLTQIVESTPIGDTSSTVSLRNNGVLTLGNSVHPGSISTDNGQVTTDGSGNLSVKNMTAGGTATITGNVSITGTLTATPKVLQKFSVFTTTVSGGNTQSVTLSHGLGTTPSMVYAQPTSSTASISQIRISSITSTQCTLTVVGGASYSVTFSCIAFV